MDEVFRQRGRAQAMVGHVNAFLSATVLQLRLVHSAHMADPRVAKGDVDKLYSCMIGSIITVSPARPPARPGESNPPPQTAASSPHFKSQR